MNDKLSLAGQNITIQPRDDPRSTTKLQSTENKEYHKHSSPNLHQFISKAALMLYQKTIKDMTGTHTDVTTMNAQPVS